MKYTVTYTLTSPEFPKFNIFKTRNIFLKTYTWKSIPFKKYMQWDPVGWFIPGQFFSS